MGEEESVGFVWRLDGSAPPQAILQTGYGIDELQVSPDGRFLAYISTESGQYEGVLCNHSGDQERRCVSRPPGGSPKWRPDGKELFYVAPNRKLMSVRILPGRDVSISLPEPLFDLSDFQPDQDEYAPSLDGQRFLVEAAGRATRDPNTPTAHLELEWPGNRRGASLSRRCAPIMREGRQTGDTVGRREFCYSQRANAICAEVSSYL